MGLRTRTRPSWQARTVGPVGPVQSSISRRLLIGGLVVLGLALYLGHGEWSKRHKHQQNVKAAATVVQQIDQVYERIYSLNLSLPSPTGNGHLMAETNSGVWLYGHWHSGQLVQAAVQFPTDMRPATVLQAKLGLLQECQAGDRFYLCAILYAALAQPDRDKDKNG